VALWGELGDCLTPDSAPPLRPQPAAPASPLWGHRDSAHFTLGSQMWCWRDLLQTDTLPQKITPIILHFPHAFFPLILDQFKQISNWLFTLQLQLTKVYGNRFGWLKAQRYSLLSPTILNPEMFTAVAAGIPSCLQILLFTY